MDHNKHRKALNISSQLLRSSRLSCIGIASCFGLTGLIVTTLLCPVSSRVHAAEAIPASENVLTSDTASISIAIDDAMVAVSLNPNENNGFAAGSTKVRVTTDNSSGYKLSMSTLDGTSNLSRDDGLDSQIQAVSGTVSPSSFKDNTWGYSLAEGDTSGTDFQAVPGSSTNVAETDTAEQGTWTLTFGAKVSKTLPAGEYKNKVIISAVANPPVLTGLNRIDTMQAMTHEICEQANVHDSKQLVDVRDGKSYWVTKLADGNCWMTQNLGLDFQDSNGNLDSSTGNPTTYATTVLTSETSDLGWSTSNGDDGSGGAYPVTPKTWSGARVTETVVASLTDNSQTDTRSWDFGIYYEQIPHDGSRSCLVTSQSAGGISNCVGSGKALSTNWADTGLSDAEQAKHYLIGNYYSWNTATAGTGGNNMDQAKVTDSICPRNWKLAKSGGDQKSGSFWYLLDQYGLASNIAGTGKDGKPYNIAQNPLFFVRGGFVYTKAELPGLGVGSEGRYWSSTLSSAYAYLLWIFPASDGRVVPSTDTYRGFANSVRCLAR